MATPTPTNPVANHADAALVAAALAGERSYLLPDPVRADPSLLGNLWRLDLAAQPSTQRTPRRPLARTKCGR